ncbi:MAG: prepilin-type N-terminal cleavage/methylation domain-containing protein [Crocosphaera sp.]|nr:prepilin-type N-terminal cleavage/methylation domain-containing protein [Crocosphaera sp.]
MFSLTLKIWLLTNYKLQKNYQGFTLLELLISATIVGILSTIAIPAYVATVDKFHYGEAKLQMGCLKRELEAFRTEKGYFPADVSRDNVPLGIECFLTKKTTLTPYNSKYDYENWTTSNPKGCIVKITFLGKDGERQTSTSSREHHQPGFHDDRERDSNSDDLILSLGVQPIEPCSKSK